MISVIIPVKEGGVGLRYCLDAVAAQEIDEEWEVVVVDSGSRDGSAEVAREAGARVHVIAPEEFNHGATRNLGARLARGDKLVFLSQDAYPAGRRWLARLTAPLDAEPELAGVYGRQLAHEDAVPPEVYFLDFVYGTTPRIQRATRTDELSMETTLFSNVNSAIRRSLWEEMPFVDDIVMSEDQEWSRRALLAGWLIRYEPDAAVRHSHPYTLRTAFRRFFDSGASGPRTYLTGGRPSARVLRHVALRYARGELRWLWAHGHRAWIPYAAVYEVTKFCALQLGVREALLPTWLKRRLSGRPDYWQ